MPVLEALRVHLDEPRAVFVFPTEVAARFWLRRAFSLTRRRALPSDRFLSWDRFAREHLDYGQPGRPAGPAERTLFAAGLLAGHRRRPFFRQLVPAGAEPLAFLPTLRELLPRLHHLARVPDRWPASSAGKLEDLQALDREYRAFLRRAGLYEPAFHEPAVRAQDRSFLLLYPEVLEEFPALEHCLSSAPQVRIVGLPPADPARLPPITAWPDSLQEVAWVLTRTAELLDAGTDPVEIALTVADLPALEPLLRRQAELLEVPLTVHRRRPLAEYPPCRVFGRIQAAVDSRFGLPELRGLLLDRSLPWREEALGRALLRLGVERRVLRSPPPPGPDRWELAFKQATAGAGPKAVEPLRLYYRRLRSELEHIAAAPDFRSLKESLTRFSKSLLDAHRWSSRELEAYRFALDTLDGLQEAARFVPELPSSAFRIWLSFLQNTHYGPQEPEAGVAAYAFQVSAGIGPQHHFVLGASQEASRCLLKPLPFLGAHEEEALGLAGKELDLAEARLRLYALGGGEVCFSYARRSPGRSHLPPGLFVSARAVREPPAGGRPHPYAAETAAWAGDGPPPSPLLPVQQEGFRRARSTALAPRGWDAAGEPLADPSLRTRVLDQLREAGGLLHLSPSGMETYLACPLRFLLELVLGLQEPEDDPVRLQPREHGTLLHRILLEFGRRVQQEEPRAALEPSRRPLYSSWMRRGVHRVFRDFARRGPAPVEPVWRRARARALELAERFLDQELEVLPGRRFLHLERTLRRELPAEGIVLLGKIDRVSEEEDEGRLLLDYKMNKAPPRARIFGPEPTSLQMPFYLELLEAAGLPARSAAYYSIQKARYIWVLGGTQPMTDEAGMAEARAGLRRRVAAMTAALAAGDFTAPAVPDCDYCGLRAVCRERYALRRSRG